MLKQRILTCLILVPLVFLTIYYGNTWTRSGAVILLFVTLGWEWLSLIPINKLMTKIFFMILLLMTFMASINLLDIFLRVNFFIWASILIAVCMYPKSEKIWGNKYVVCIACLLIMPTFLSSLYIVLQSKGSADAFVYLLLLVWATDIGGYFFGKSLGKHKLIPAVSPGKTIEGTAGGFFIAMLIAALGYFYFEPSSVLLWFFLAFFTVAISILGDLFISMLKRRCKLKDTGQILPGHGGVLDRLDSLIAALPFFYLFQEIF
ncbi:MAG: phosphatidate cytidylyltransferase [Legionellaceae bacterium]|nr:phosphatidate cytidylyltransferase [Legionellaceae bacterium]